MKHRIDPEGLRLPIKLDTTSNGEFEPLPDLLVTAHYWVIESHVLAGQFTLVNHDPEQRTRTVTVSLARLSAQRLLQQQARERRTPAPLLVIAPRRPERFEEVAASIVAQGFALQRHSARRAGDGDGIDAQDVEVLLLDAMGELLPYYAAADAVFVGGSIAVVGGHNLLEPAALGKPVLAGPHTGNAPQVAALLEAAHGLVRVTDATTLAGRLGDWFADPAQARRCGSAAAAVVADNAGATTRVLEAITAALALQAGPAAPRPRCPSAGRKPTTARLNCSDVLEFGVVAKHVPRRRSDRRKGI